MGGGGIHLLCICGTIISTNMVLYALYVCLALCVCVCVYGVWHCVCVCVCMGVRCMALCVCVCWVHTQLYICGSKHLPVD